MIEARSMANISVFPDSESLVAGAADLIIRSAAQAMARHGRFTLALAGGDTPRPVYARLAGADCLKEIDWSRVFIFFGDERCVPPYDPRSNYLMARTVLLDKAPIPRPNIYRIHGEEEPEKAAKDYEGALRHVLGEDALSDGPPSVGLDLVLLGMGDNGHTASLFPGLAAVTETKRWVMAAYVEVASMWRITMTPVVINAARQVVFLVSGAKKAHMVKRVLDGPSEPVVLPARAVRPASGELLWLLDKPAAAELRIDS
ncbi:MAG: 6-phosphogluconolactonase [Syntrophobacteraceae bacterium]|nr:6-phosphogluconolactonase [Syntrophobacteraceae bacterium]